MANKKLLVTGGSGYIGLHMIDLLIASDFEVVAIDNFSNSLARNIDPKVTFIEGDANSLIACADLVKSLLGWKPEFSSIDEIISSAWKWEKLQ